MGTSGTAGHYVIVDRWVLFYWTRFIWQQCAVR